MASEMRVACVLCASHPCVRGGLRRPLPSCWPRAIGRACRLWGVARGTAWRGAERVRGSLVAPVRRERPWARFHKHNHPPKRSHCHIRQTLLDSHAARWSTAARPGPGPPCPNAARATTRARARTAAKPLLGAPASGPTTRRREHPRRSSAGNTLTTYVTARLSTPTRLQNSTDRSARERARTGPRG